MNRIIIVMMLTFTAICANAQYTDIVYPKKDVAYPKTPGTYLRQASNSFIGGFILTAVGGGCLAIGANSSSETVDRDTGKTYSNDNKTIFTALGAGLMAVGVILEIRGIVLIGRAGDAMNKERKTALVLQPKANGASLVFKF